MDFSAALTLSFFITGNSFSKPLLTTIHSAQNHFFQRPRCHLSAKHRLIPSTTPTNWISPKGGTQPGLRSSSRQRDNSQTTHPLMSVQENELNPALCQTASSAAPDSRRSRIWVFWRIFRYKHPNGFMSLRPTARTVTNTTSWPVLISLLTDVEKWTW